MKFARHVRNLWNSTLFGTIFLFAPPVAALELDASDAFLCDKAIAVASRDVGVPQNILKAVALTESGLTVEGNFVPWAWTVNVAGRSARFKTQAGAYEFFRSTFEQGSRNIDLGCFQVNHRWHGANFSSARDMLNPLTNARYAAQFLKSLYSEFGDWVSAVGAYHSREHALAQTYLERYIPISEQLSDTPGNRSGSFSPSAGENRFPLLMGTSDSGARGSLFPVGTRAGRRMFGASDIRG